jgi:membrane associated rhomboid family serine protease
MARRSSMTMGFPPVTYAVKWLVIVNCAVYVLALLANGLGFVSTGAIHEILGLVPYHVVHGWIWQVVTYSFIHYGIFHLLFNMLALWMFGSQFEIDWGRRQFLEFFFFCVVGAAITSIVVGYGGLLAYQFWQVPLFRSMASLTLIPTVGASGGIYGILLAYGILYGNREILLWFVLPVKAKYMVAVFIFIALVGALGDSGGVANFAHLGGAFFGWIYLRFIPRKGLGFATSEGYYGIRNSYIKWRRRRAAKKFEVYMRDKNQPTNYNDYFDEYGNYKDPKSGGKDNGEGRPPWVN